MAYDKVIDSSLLDGNLTSIANAIREKAGLSDNFAFPQGFIDAISGIESGGASILDMPFVCGSFIATEDIASTYTIDVDFTPIKDDSTFSTSRYSVIVFRKPNENKISTSSLANSLLLSWYIPVYVSDDGSSNKHKLSIYFDMYGSLRFSSTSDAGVGFVGIDQINIRFTSSVYAKAGQEYVYMVVRMI